MATQLLIVDDHVMFREGLASLFKDQPDFHVVGQVGSVADAIRAVKKNRPDMVLMDFNLPDGTGLDATKVILKDYPETLIVFLTMFDGDEKLYDALRAGAKGYLLKNLPVSKLTNALRGVTRGEAALTREMTSRLLDKFAKGSTIDKNKDHTQLGALTDREIEVLQEIGTGASNKEIAARLCVSINTVKNHVSNIYNKLDIKNRREAVRFAQDLQY